MNFSTAPCAAALARLTATQAHLFAVLPQTITPGNKELVVAGVGPLDEELRPALEELVGCGVELQAIAAAELAAALVRWYPHPQEHEVPLSPLEPAGQRTAVPVLRLCRRAILLATDPAAAGVFLLPQAVGGALRVAFLNGCREEERLPTTFLAQLAVRQLKHFAGLALDSREPQLGGLEIPGLKREFRLEVETFANQGYECARVEVLE